MNERYIITEPELRQYCYILLQGCNMNEESKDILTDATVTAEMRGHASHGISRLPSYIKRIKKGLINGRASMQIEQNFDSTLLLDADNGLGQVAAYEGMNLAIQRAREKGSCWVGIKNTNHIGMAGYYTELAAKHGMVGMIMANSSPAAAPWGGVKPFLGTNPFSLAAPAKGKPVILDMATTNVARGKIRMYAKMGWSLLPGWAKDTEGKETQDPHKALEGTLLPVGGPKGYGLALMIDILSGVITGSGSNEEVAPVNDYSRKIDSGIMLFALNIEAMINYKYYLNRIEELKQKIKNSPTAEGVNELMLPGEVEYQAEENHSRNGIEVDEKIYDEVNQVINKS